MDSRYTARLLAIGRVGLGLALLIAPGLGARLIGARPTGRTRLLVRLFAARDVVIGAGTYRALAEGSPAAGWVRAGAAADAADAAAIVLTADELGPAAALVGGAVATTAAIVGFGAARDVDA